MEMKKNKPKNLPKGNENKLREILRVNHAGEYGAKRIYQGQLAILKKNTEIKHMLEQELIHLKYFENEINKRNIKPTVFQPIWHCLGFMLGGITGIMGEKAAMACTIAVEEVIEEHYNQQLQDLKNFPDEKDLKQKIEKFRDEELEHRDIGIDKNAKDFAGYKPLYYSVQLASKLAIWLSKRI